MKKIIVFILVILIYLYHKKNREKLEKENLPQSNPAEQKPISSGGATSSTTDQGDKSTVKKAIIAISRIYGYVTDPGGTNRVTLDIPAEDATGLTLGDSVSLEGSRIYPGHYKIQQIDDNGSKKAIVLDMIFMGAEGGIYLKTDPVYLSPFTASLKPKSAFV